MKKTLSLLAITLSSVLISSIFIHSSSLAAIYQWQDESGVTHYSDDGNQSSTVKAKRLKTLPPAMDKVQLPQPVSLTPKPKEFTATKIELTKPQDQQTIRNNIGKLTIMASLSKPIKATEKIRLLINSAIKKQQQSPAFTLFSVPLGEHKLQLQLISQSGKILASSKLITIYMHRFKAK